jgi:hypothetical protein
MEGGLAYAGKDAVQKVADATKEVQNAAMSMKVPVEVPAGGPDDGMMNARVNNGLVTPKKK